MINSIDSLSSFLITDAASDSTSRQLDQSKLEDVGRQFEGILWRQFLSSALKPSTNGGGLLSNKGPGGDIHHSLLVDNLAQAMTTQSLGFSDILKDKLLPSQIHGNDTCSA